MKHGGLGLIVCALFASGCVTGLDTRPDAKSAPAPAVEHVVRAPVRPELVTPQNAHKQAQALWDECDRETEEGSTKR